MFWRRNKPAIDKSLSLAECIRKAPRLSAPRVAKRAVAELLTDSASATANSLKRLFERKPVRRLVEGIADGSPFLWGLIREDPPRLAELLDANPKSHLAGLIARRTQAARAAADQETIARELRLAGMVTDGSVRDLRGICEVGLPVFSRPAVTPNGARKNGPGEVNVPVAVGGVPVLPGDIVIGDANGVVVVEHFHKSSPDDQIGHLALVKTYRYGDTCLSVYRSVREEIPP